MTEPIKCSICGHEFHPRKRRNAKYCCKCNDALMRSVRLEDKRRKKKSPNENIYAAVRAAEKLGLTYSKYMGRRFEA